jgi:hypothetical protein
VIAGGWFVGRTSVPLGLPNIDALGVVTETHRVCTPACTTLLRERENRKRQMILAEKEQNAHRSLSHTNA